MKKNELFLLTLSFLLPLWVYCYTLCPTVSVYADAGEFPFAAYVNSFGHPPGYPLFILIIKLFQLLPFGNPALKANLAAAFISASTLPFFLLLTKQVTKNLYSSFFATLTLAFSRIYWKNALVSEAFGLLAFFIVVSTYLYLSWEKTKKKRYFYLFLLAVGFGLSHHQLIIATLLPLFFDFLKTKKWRLLKAKDYPIGISLVLFGFLPYLYIYHTSQSWPLMNWENPSNLKNLFRLLTRASYGTFILTSSFKKVLILPQTIEVIKLFFRSFTPFGIILFLIGCFTSFKENKKIFYFSFFIIILIGFCFSYYSRMPLTDSSEVHYLERFQIISSIFIALIAGFGFKWIRFPKLILPILLLLLNFSAVNQKNNYFGQYLAEDLLSTVPEKSIFLIEGDAIINSLFYHRFVLGKNSNTVFIIADLLANQAPWYLKELKLLYPDLIFPQPNNNSLKYLNEFLALNYQYRRIFMLIPGFENQQGASFYKIPQGLVYEFIPFSPNVDVSFLESPILNNYPNYQNLKKIDFASLATKESVFCGCGPTPTPIPAYFPEIKKLKPYPKDWPENDLMFTYARPLLFLAQATDDKNKKERYYLKAAEISPYNYYVWFETGNFYLENQKPRNALEAYQNALRFAPDKKTYQEIKKKIKLITEK